METAVKMRLALLIIALSLVGISARPCRAAETSIEQMPAELETRFALSALPPALRDKATIYLLDPGKGYRLSRNGTSGVTCLVESTAWEQADFRNDVAPIMRTWMLPDLKVHTMSMPHLMFYAANITDEDIGAVPSSNLLYPFIFKEGIAEQSYMIQLIGEAEKAKIMAAEKTLLDDLCAYRDFLCLPNRKH